MDKQQEIMESAIKEEIDFIAYVDMETGVLRTIVTNAQSCVLPPECADYQEINNTCIPRYIHPEDRERCKEEFLLSSIREKLSEKERLEVSYRLLCGGEYRRKTMSFYYYNEKKDTLVLVRHDVTESFAEEMELREKLYEAMQEAKQADRSKSEFLERMSHEIRTPMNSIIGLSYLSRENIKNEKQVLENLDKIEKSAQFLRTLIDDILNLSLLESGRVADNKEVIAFTPFLEELCRDISRKAEEKQIHFSMQARGDFEKEYLFDGEKLREALFGILENAVKYTLPEGRIDFIVELLMESEKNATFRFEVHDTGIGMDEKFLPRAFDAFEQEGDGDMTLYGGTGLGLTISKNIIEFMGGRIDAYSEKGKGSTFVATVALEKAFRSGRSRKRYEKSGGITYDFTGKRILLVEDNEINIEITKNILLHKNFAVDVAWNGKEALECFLGHEAGYYDAILMDIRMPVMDGLAATRKIRQSGRPDSGKIPIIAMTANVFEEDVKKSFEAGMNAHLSKPVDIRQMYELLDEVIFE